MIKTLHGYFLRELLKTFFMTAAALTGLLVMGGGVANIFQAQGLGAKDMGRLFAFFTPVAATMILPVAALFSTAICYGRASADNEITACRAAGINVHRLLFSAALLGTFVTGATYYAWNFMIPVLSGKVEELTRRDLPAIVTGQFVHNKALHFGKYWMYAEDFKPLEGDLLPRDTDDPDAKYKKYLYLSGVSFVEMQDEQIARFGTSNYTFVIFNQSPKLPSPTVEVQLNGVRAVDRSRPITEAIDMQRQILGPFEIPLPLKRKIKFQDLPTLRHYRHHIEEIPEVSDLLFKFKRRMIEQYLYQDVIDHVHEGYVLRGADVTYRILAQQQRQSPSDNKPELADVTVEETTKSGESRMLTAPRAGVEVKNSMDRERPNVVFELTGGVKIRQLPGTPNDRVVTLDKQSLLPVPVLDQPTVKARVSAIDPLVVLNPRAPFGNLTPKLIEERTALIKKAQRFASEVTGEIHFRATYAASAIAVILIGAMLGIIMRGGQVLTAFGISCVPTAIVIVASIVGRNLSDQPEKWVASLAVMWGATAFMYLATIFVGTKLLQR